MKISIITASYNYEKYIKSTIESVIAQTYTDWELIVIDDCSTDNSVEIIKSFDDERIKLVINETNLGLSKTLEKAVNLAQGDWIAFLESDDLWMKNHLEEKVKIIEKYPDTAIIFNDVEMFGDENTINHKKSVFSKYFQNLPLKDLTYPRNMFKDVAIFNYCLTFSALCINKEKLLECSFNTPTDRQIDWWLIIHLAQNYDFYYISQKLTKWRMHMDSYINKKEKIVSVPMNLITLFEIFKTTKNLKVFLLMLKLIVLTHGLLIRKLKSILGLPLRDNSF